MNLFRRSKRNETKLSIKCTLRGNINSDGLQQQQLYTCSCRLTANRNLLCAGQCDTVTQEIFATYLVVEALKNEILFVRVRRFLVCARARKLILKCAQRNGALMFVDLSYKNVKKTRLLQSVLQPTLVNAHVVQTHVYSFLSFSFTTFTTHPLLFSSVLMFSCVCLRRKTVLVIMILFRKKIV